MEIERDLVIANPNSDLGVIGGASLSFHHHPSVCGVSSDLRALKVSGVSPNPRNDICPPPPQPQPPNSVREKEKMISEIIESILEARRKGIEPSSDDDRDVPALPDPPEYDSDDWKDAPVVPYEDLDFLECDPDVLECEICGRADDHYDHSCPYLFEFPAGGKLHNTSDYIIVCDECGEEAVDGRCPDEKRHPSSTKRVVIGPSELTFDDSP